MILPTINRADVHLWADGTSSFPLWVDSVSIQHAFSETVIPGRPSDFINRVWQGGTVSISGFLATPDIFNFIGFIEKITVEPTLSGGTIYTMYGCRPKEFSVQAAGGDEGWLKGSFTYTFNGFA